MRVSPFQKRKSYTLVTQSERTRRVKRLQINARAKYRREHVNLFPLDFRFIALAIIRAKGVTPSSGQREG